MSKVSCRRPKHVQIQIHVIRLQNKDVNERIITLGMMAISVHSNRFHTLL